MSGQPDICIDIFTAISNMLRSFNNIGLSGGDTFSHESGFAQSTDPTAASGNPGEPVNFEDQMNNYSFMLFIGTMIFFLAYQHLGGLLQPGRNTTKINGFPSSGNGNNGAGGVH